MKVYFVTINAFGHTHTGRYQASTRDLAVVMAKHHVGLTIKSSNSIDPVVDHTEEKEKDG